MQVDPQSYPFYLQKISKKYLASHGGDLLVGFWGPHATIREIDTNTKKVVWQYGSLKKLGRGAVYDKLYTSVCALRYGISEAEGGVTIIVDERSRIFCVNKKKEMLWEMGKFLTLWGGQFWPVCPAQC